jgi:hypothetical protein
MKEKEDRQKKKQERGSSREAAGVGGDGGRRDGWQTAEEGRGEIR